MKMLAEEKRSGTIELLLTKAVTAQQVVLGKFLACLILIFVALLLTIPYYITVSNIGNVDHGAILTGYLGLLFMSAAYISIGLYTSSITNNQIIAFMSALFIGLFFQLLFDVLAGNNIGFFGRLFDTLSLSTHYDSISRGVIDSKDIIYFLSIIIIGLKLSELSLAKSKLLA